MDKNSRTRSASVLLNDFLTLALGISDKTASNVADQIRKDGELADMKQHVREIKGEAFTQLNSGLTKLKKQIADAAAGGDEEGEEEAKPDFADVDKDGDKKEPVKKASKEKEEELKEGSMPSKRINPDPQSDLYKAIKNHPRYHINGYSYFRGKGYDDEDILAFWNRPQEKNNGPDDWGMPALKEGYTFISHLLNELEMTAAVAPDYTGTDDKSLTSVQLRAKRQQMNADPKRKRLDKKMQGADSTQERLAAENQRHMQAIQKIKAAGVS